MTQSEYIWCVLSSPPTISLPPCVLAKGPFAVKKTDVTPGCIIEKIDGKPIVKGQDYFPLLEGKAGRKVLLAIYNPATGKRFDITIKACLLYTSRCV